MNISLDGGALCARPGSQFGTARFATELVKALRMYSGHQYTIYQFCPAPYQEGKTNLSYKHIFPATGWMKVRIPLEERLHPHEIFLGLNQALPRYTKARKIAFSHGLSFAKFPDLYPKDYKRLSEQLKDYTDQADAIVVSSRQVKKELVDMNEELKGKIAIIPFGLPQAYADFSVMKVHKERYFLYVGSDQPIKNIQHLIDTFVLFRKEKGCEDFTLLLIGTNLSNLPDGVRQVQHASLEDLQKWYCNASAYITVSLYESFNFPVVEALSLGCPVIGYKSAIIPEQRQFTVIADDQEDLIDLMKHAANGNMPHIDRKLLLSRFSWENYVKLLEKLYNTV